MQFIIDLSLKRNIFTKIRRLGYKFLGSRKNNLEFNFVRQITGNPYPRFHLYIKLEKEKMIFNLHLDQKLPSYKGSRAHSGVYEGEIIEKEVERIKSLLKK